ncbi:MAG: hypothetical protein U0Q03_11765 [Acidimicrobiales bacterium]
MSRSPSAVEVEIDRELELVPSAMIATVVTAAWLLNGVVGMWLAVVGGLGRDSTDTVADVTVVSIVVGELAYLTWCWWCTIAAINARRLTPLATSPLFPPIVYLGGPLIVGVSFAGTGEVYRSGPWIGVAVVVLGHLAVLASLRSTTRRLRGDGAVFSHMLWVPFVATMTGNMVVRLLADGFDDDQLVRAHLAVVSLVSVLQGGLVWSATASFDRLCRTRADERNQRGVAPSADLVLASIARGG